MTSFIQYFDTWIKNRTQTLQLRMRIWVHVQMKQPPTVRIVHKSLDKTNRTSIMEIIYRTIMHRSIRTRHSTLEFVTHQFR